VFIVGVADQLQTNYATDLRHMLKSVFDSYTSHVVTRLDAANDSGSSLVDAYQQQTTPTDDSSASFGSHLTGRTITSDETIQNNNNNHHSASSLLGTVISEASHLFDFTCHHHRRPGFLQVRENWKKSRNLSGHGRSGGKYCFRSQGK